MLLVLPLNVQGAEECGLQYDPSAQHDAWHAEQAKQPVDFGYHTLCMSALLLIVLYTPTSCICAVRLGSHNAGSGAHARDLHGTVVPVLHVHLRW